jgi:hypothetical protein
VLNYATLFVGPEEGTGLPENLAILVVRVVGHLVLSLYIYIENGSLEKILELFTVFSLFLL